MQEKIEKLRPLVEQFRAHIKQYKSAGYDEANVRVDFIDKFFEILDWDVRNTQGFSEDYREVVREDKVIIAGKPKAPDYSFRIGGRRKFFVEAKKPIIYIKEEIDPAYQVRRYGYTAKLPISILTDFEEFAVYDTRIKPSKKDKASVGRIYYCMFDEYEKNFEFIYNTFSKNAVLKGSFDGYIRENKSKKGTSEVDREFLELISEWREKLAKNIAVNNPKTDIMQVNTAVQKIIDRLIFLRIAEDRGTEPYENLRKTAGLKRVFTGLTALFEKAREKYNGDVFRTDESVDKLSIDNEILTGILEEMYYPDCPYEFSVFPIEVLGNIYEQFLGKTIRLTEGHHAKIEEKPEVRKAGGVYYTPQYIVNYIVENTVGARIGAAFDSAQAAGADGSEPERSRRAEPMTPAEISKLKILDPACGSGSFLIGAYTYLLDYHLKYYTDTKNLEKAIRDEKIFRIDEHHYHLTIREKQNILLNNIYGVDIDTQAVEVTKLSLLLKLMENETKESEGKLFKHSDEKYLPNLSNNIKCGNSLIGSDFYDDKDMGLFGKDELRKVNTFDWEKEFPEVFPSTPLGERTKSPNGEWSRTDRGFDVVIGNPPWGADFDKFDLEYLRIKNKDIIMRMIDSFMYFINQSFNLLKKGSYFGMILPDVVLYQNDNELLRKKILKLTQLKVILNLGNVFDAVTRPTSIIIFQIDSILNNKIIVNDLTNNNRTEKQQEINNKSSYTIINQASLFESPSTIFITSNPEQYNILNTIYTRIPNKPLIDFVDNDGIQRGVSPDLKKAFIVDSKTIQENELEKEFLRKVLSGGKQVKRYYIEYVNLFLIYTKNTDDFTKLPNICKYIGKFKDEITCVEVKEKKHSIYALHRARDENIFKKQSKFMGVITEDEIIVSIDKTKSYATDGLYLFSIINDIDERYLIGVLNSRLFVFLYRLLSSEKGRVLAQVKPTIIGKLPIRIIDHLNKNDKSSHDQMINLVDQMLETQKLLHSAKTDHDCETYQKKADLIDGQIDRLVYELYGLTEEEIRIVEGNE